MLLKATWPSDAEAPTELINQIVKYSIPAFKYSKYVRTHFVYRVVSCSNCVKMCSQDADADSDPYLMTLHKLWTKMCEEDWRSAAKALFILHTVSRDCAPDQCRKFAAALK